MTTLLLALLLGTARADFCFPNTCTATVTPAGSATATATSTATRTNSGTFTATPTPNPTQFSVSAKVTAYAGQAAVGHGVGAVLASGYQVAWSGSSTDVFSQSIVAGIYVIEFTASTTTADTVTVQVTYTDAVNSTAQTVNVLDGLGIGANGVRSGHICLNATPPTAVVLKISSATQTTTKVSGQMRRMQ